jgi:hypothetical protein
MGAHGSGIRTLDHVRDRCDINEVTECWVWARAYNTTPEKKSMTPTAWFPAEQRVVSVPRIVAVLSGKRLERGWRCYNVCSTPGCVNPEHLATGNGRMWGAYMARSGRMQTVSAKAARIRQGATKVKITDEQVMEIMASDEVASVLAKRYNVAKATICKIKRGERKMRLSPGASIFAWRP